MSRIAVCTLFTTIATSAWPAPGAGDVWRLQMSPYTRHYKPQPDHHRVWALGFELERSEGTLHGIAFFRNSFGQSSLYAYPWGGVHRNLFNVERLFVKWSIGILYGYKHPYEDKVPFNHHGFSPVIVPAIGLALTDRVSVQLNFLGTSGLQLQISKDL